MYDLFDDNVIHITRGNSITIQIALTETESGDPFIMLEGDSVLFTVKKNNGDKVIQKQLTPDDYDPEQKGVLLCNVVPSETINLITGEYHYDCLLLTSDGSANTFISSALLVDEAIGTYTDISHDEPEEPDVPDDPSDGGDGE